MQTYCKKYIGDLGEKKKNKKESYLARAQSLQAIPEPVWRDRHGYSSHVQTYCKSCHGSYVHNYCKKYQSQYGMIVKECKRTMEMQFHARSEKYCKVCPHVLLQEGP